MMDKKNSLNEWKVLDIGFLNKNIMLNYNNKQINCIAWLKFLYYLFELIIRMLSY